VSDQELQVREAPGWVPITRGEFWDVPRVFVVGLATVTVLFDGSFDEGLDDYAPSYAIYRLPSNIIPPFPNTWPKWEDLSARREPIGTVRVADVRFDPTRRQFAWSDDIAGVIEVYRDEVIELVQRHRGDAPPCSPPPPRSPYR
jgi:hypothetical protein